MGFELCGKRTGQKRRCKHDGKGYWVFTAIGCQRQPGFRQKIIKQDDTQKSGQHAAGISAGKSGGQKHAQQVNHDDIGVRKAKPQKDPSDDRRSCQNPDGQKQFPCGRKRRTDGKQPFPAVALIGFHIRNDMNVHLWCKRNEPFCQRRFTPKMPPLYATSPNHNFGHIRETHIFRDLCCHIFTMRCDDLCAKLLSQTHIHLQANGIFRIHISVFGCLHVKRGKAATKCLCHFPCHSYNAFIGWRRGQAHKNMLFWQFASFVLHIFTIPLKRYYSTKM